MDERTPPVDVPAARAEIAAARGALLDEVDALQASARAAVDIPARIRREPIKAAGVAAGAGFLALGGPKKIVRGVRRRVRRLLGRPADPLPASLLPDEVERIVRRLGDDGAAVRATLEHDFAGYVDQKRKEREKERRRWVKLALRRVGLPLARRYGTPLIDQILSPDPARFEQTLERLRRRRGGGTAAPTAASTDEGTATNPGPARAPRGPAGQAGSSGG